MVKAIDIVKNTNSIDLILMDIKLEGINGIQASTIIHDFNPQIPIIAQTACVMPVIRKNALRPVVLHTYRSQLMPMNFFSLSTNILTAFPGKRR
jgi:CheY-like chemotaxis protein